MKRCLHAVVVVASLVCAQWVEAKMPALEIEVTSLKGVKVSEESVEFVVSGVARIAAIVPVQADGEDLVLRGRTGGFRDIVVEDCAVVLTRQHSDLPEMEERLAKHRRDALALLQSKDPSTLLVVMAQEADITISTFVVRRVRGVGLSAYRKAKEPDRGEGPAPGPSPHQVEGRADE